MGASVGKVLGKGGNGGRHCEYAAGMLERPTGIVEMALGHCRTAARLFETVCEVKGVGIVSLVGSG